MVSSASADDDIYDLIFRGQREQARTLLGQQDNIRESGTLLYFQALLEPSAARAARLMESALERKADRKYQEEIYFRLTQYYLLIESPAKVVNLANEYRIRWDRGRYRAAMFRMMALAQELADNLQAARQVNTAYLEQWEKGDLREWGLIDNARILVASKQDGPAYEILEDLARSGSEVGAPQAAYLLAFNALERRDTDAALVYFDKLQADYPEAIGINFLQKRLGRAVKRRPESEQRPAGWLRAEEGKLPGYFAIKVGAFLKRDHAKNQAERVQGERLRADIETTKIDNRTYYIVYLGKFTSREQVERVKQSLEEQYGEKYEVIIR